MVPRAAVAVEHAIQAPTGVELLQEGGGGWADVETTMTSTDEFSGNGGAFVAPLGGGTSSVDSTKGLEKDEAFFATGDADTRGVELLQEGGGGWADVETTMTSTDEFSGNGGAFVAPLGGGTSSVDSTKGLEKDEAFFATGDADTRMEHHQHQHPPDWMRAFERFRPRTSGRKLLGMAKASTRGGGVVRRLLTKGAIYRI
ncbi:unnamed protein product [Ectocarpus sp. CCAP 1310/34]|nr:unnamed protein product [Ectocarpus sp. CCAP 1310/34]